MCTVTLVMLAAPAALGAALGPVLHQLGDATEHVCKCGMRAGTCGCPSCERLEHQRLLEHQVDRMTALKRHCDDEAPAMPLGTSLPSGMLAAASDGLLAVPRGDRLPVHRFQTDGFSTDQQPPTPPPRLATV